MTWTSKVSSSGKVFFYNTITKEKTWKQPIDFVPPPPSKRFASQADVTELDKASCSNQDKDSALHSEQIPKEYAETPDPRFLQHIESGNYYEIETGHFWKWNQERQEYFNLSLQNLTPIVPTTPVNVTEARLKLVVKESCKYPKNSLLVIDQDGLKFGRDRNDNTLVLKELAVSRYHAQIYFKRDFWIVDVGSTHGTLLNGERLSVSKEPSDPIILQHGDILQIGSTILQVHKQCRCSDCDVHIHPIIPIGDSLIVPVRTKVSKKQRIENARLSQIQMMKESYGIDDEPVLKPIALPIRVGKPLLHKPIQAKPVVAAVDKQVDGKGKEMLLKMGWQQTGLGKNESGRLDPIALSTQKGKQGLGNL